jgi:hypothetical protein
VRLMLGTGIQTADDPAASQSFAGAGVCSLAKYSRLEILGP